MKKIVGMVLLLICVSIKAQDVVNQDANQKAKAINEVKLSEQAMYAEVVELASDDIEAISLAQQKTINKLQNNVIEACARRMNLTKEQAKEIFDVIDDKCQNVVIKKGDMVRVFSYIAKDAVGLSRKKAKQKDLDEFFGTEDTDSVAIAQNTNQAINLIMGRNDSIDNVSLSEVPVNTVQQSVQKNQTEQIMAGEQQVSSSTPVVATTANAVVTTQPEITKSTEPKIEAKSEPTKEVVVPALCKKLIAIGKFDGVLRYLEQEKTYQKLMYGAAKTMQRPERCYIIITDKVTGDVTAILDKGEAERMNFITKKMDNFRNYQGGNNRAIFVQEY